MSLILFLLPQLVGDCLLGSSFLSYMGAFTTDYRRDLIYNKCLKDVHERNVPLSAGFSLEALLTTDAIVQVSQGVRERLVLSYIV